MVSPGWRYDPIAGVSESEQDGYTSLISAEIGKDNSAKSKNPAHLFSKGSRSADGYYKTAKALLS